MTCDKVLAVDIGRSTIKAAVLKRRRGRFVIGEVERCPATSPTGDITQLLVDLLRQQVQSEGDVEAVGIGTAGQVSPLGVVSATQKELYGQQLSLGEWLTDRLQVPVLVRNDVQLMALAEALYGAGRKWPVVFGVAIGSGVGGGIVRDGRLDIGSGGIAGECGHVRAVDRGERRDCWCGGKGCLEVHVSGLAIEARYEAMTGVAARATDVLASRRADSAASVLVDSVMRELVTGLEILACCVNPDGIVLGGSIGVALAPLLPALRKQISHHAYLAVQDTTLRVAELGVNAQLYGAAELCGSDA